MVPALRPSRASPLTRIALVAVACATAFCVVYVVTVRTLEGRLFGDASLRGALLTRSAFADSTERILDVVSVASLLGAVALVAVIALARLRRVEGLAAIALLVGANVSTQVLKRFVLDRPDLGVSEVAPATLNSLPSGHTTAVFSAFAALVFVVPSAWRYPSALIGLVASTATAVATMSAGWHRAGDSMAAFLLVGVWAAGTAAAILVLAPADGTRDEPFAWPGSARWLVVLACASTVLGVLLAIALSSVDPIRDSTLGSWWAFVASGLLIAGTAIAVVLGLLGVLIWSSPADQPE